MPRLAVVGNLSLDRVEGGPPRAGGTPFWAARALRALGVRAIVAAKCADADRALLARPLVALGIPVLWLGGSSTAAFSIRYEGDHREMTVDGIGDAWTPEDVRGLDDVRWVHVGALAQTDFPPETLAELAVERRLLFDGQGLVRPPRTGPLELHADYDPDVLRHMSVLKLAEEEARALVGEPDEAGLRALGVAEVVVTFGSRGSLVFADGRLERVAAQPVSGPVDPTGAGDAFAVAYMAARAGGHAPVPSAKRAGALVTGLLAGRLR
ncbi:MAG TPA: PfkB family carbohydrate kinase [Gaiellaceae bacterium]|nr:PfkB family carbohydrate kinase [Gaiellaceae bacterium]